MIYVIKDSFDILNGALNLYSNSCSDALDVPYMIKDKLHTLNSFFNLQALWQGREGVMGEMNIVYLF